MAKPTLTVTTDFGTFTRQTARTYTHIVIVKGYRAERIEAHRLAEIADKTKTLAKYRHTVATGVDPDWRQAGTVGGNWDREFTAKSLADGSYAQWIADAQASLDRLTAMAPITEDRDSWGLQDANLASTPTWAALGWCGRLDLARKLAASPEASRFRSLHIIDVATGKVVA